MEEISIHLLSGLTIAGKFWGNKSLPTILCLHGREDNAGSFDRLIPLLPRQFSYLAIDFPGHGRSSRLPNGVFYYCIDFLFIINQIIDFYAWKRVGIIAHSMSSRLSFVYASIFPHRVDMLIGIDVLKALVCEIKDLKKIVANFDKFSLADERNLSDEEPPAYDYCELVEKLYKGSFHSVSKEVAHHLLDRNIKPSKSNPGKFYFSRDRRMMFNVGIFLPQEVQIELAKKLKIPHLYIKAKDSFFVPGNHSKYDNEVIEILRNNPKFEYQEIESKSHHLHLSEVEKIASIISKFIENNKIVESHI